MLKDIVQVTPQDNYSLEILFEDGVKGIVNIAELVEFTGVFAPLKAPEYFAQVKVDPDLFTVCWPNGADLDPDVLYSKITGQPLPLFDLITEKLSPDN